jgi:hypothetical protein
VLNDLFLGVATLSFGGTLSALFSSVPLSSGYGMFAYIALPVMGAVCFTLYLARKYYVASNVASLASDILDEIPDPASESPP